MSEAMRVSQYAMNIKHTLPSLQINSSATLNPGQQTNMQINKSYASLCGDASRRLRTRESAYR